MHTVGDYLHGAVIRRVNTGVINEADQWVKRFRANGAASVLIRFKMTQQPRYRAVFESFDAAAEFRRERELSPEQFVIEPAEALCAWLVGQIPSTAVACTRPVTCHYLSVPLCGEHWHATIELLDERKDKQLRWHLGKPRGETVRTG